MVFKGIFFGPALHLYEAYVASHSCTSRMPGRQLNGFKIPNDAEQVNFGTRELAAKLTSVQECDARNDAQITKRSVAGLKIISVYKNLRFISFL